MDDLISRQAAIDALERAKQNIRHNIERAIGDAVCEILDEVENGVKQLPPIQPEPHWIPVTERLPEINEDIMLSYFDEVTIGWLNSDGSWSIFDGQECASADEISAWMPLPEPYEGVSK